MDYFSPFTPLTTPENQNPNKMKKTPRDIIILHRCTKNHCHMLYCSWDIVCDGCNCYFSFWAIFWPFTSLTAWKKKISKKMKKQKQKKQKKKTEKNTTASTTITWRYHHFTQVYQKSWSYSTLFLRYMLCDGCNYFFFDLNYFLPFYRPISPKNKNFN